MDNSRVAASGAAAAPAHRLRIQDDLETIKTNQRRPSNPRGRFPGTFVGQLGRGVFLGGGCGWDGGKPCVCERLTLFRFRGPRGPFPAKVPSIPAPAMDLVLPNICCPTSACAAQIMKNHGCFVNILISTSLEAKTSSLISGEARHVQKTALYLVVRVQYRDTRCRRDPAE